MDRNTTSAETKTPKFFYGYIVVIAGFFVLMILSGAFFSYGVFLKPIAAEFGWTRAVTSGAYSMSLIVLALMFTVTGRLTDRFGPRLVVTVCALISGLGYFLVSRINAAWHLYLVYGVVIATGQSGGLIPMTSTIARWFVKRRGLMTGIAIAGAGVGAAIAPLIATQLMLSYGWRYTYIILSVVIWVVVIAAAQFLRRDPGQVGQLPDGERVVKSEALVSEVKGITRSEAIRTWRFWQLCAIYFCYGFFVLLSLVHIVAYATDAGIPDIVASGILALSGMLGTAGRIITGIAGDKFGNKKTSIIIFVVALLALIWLQFSRELWMFYLYAVFFGFAYGGSIALEAPLTAELFGLKALGAILGIVHFGYTLGGAISPFLAGKLFDLTQSYRLAFLISLVVSAIGLLLALSLKLVPKKGVV